MSDILASRARMAIGASVALARELGHGHVLPIHLVAGLHSVPGTAINSSLTSAGMTTAALSEFIATTVTPQMLQGSTATFTPAASAILNDAAFRASRSRMRMVDENLLTVTLLDAQDELVGDLLNRVSVHPDDIKQELVSQLPAEPSSDRPKDAQDPAAPTPIVTGLTLPKNLADFVTNLTASTDRNPVFGRENELERLYVILGRRSKNNPVLVGEAGVGKTAVVEALAAAIAEKNAPDFLEGCAVLEVDMGSLMAGTRNRGDFEERMKNLLDFTSKSKTPVILFFDEIHSMVGAGASSDSSMNAGNLLKPALARGQVRILGATTLDEYRKYIEKDSALERRFAKVTVAEPDVELAQKMLENWAAELADHHKVSILPEAVTASVKLSDKWITDRRLPDKAIDVLDETCARLSLRSTGTEQPRIVDAKLVAEVVSATTGIPLSSIDTDTAAGLMGLYDRMSSRLVGQDEAVRQVCKAVLRRRSGIDSMQRPASFLFAGPTGVGKTELAKVLADEMLGGQGTANLITVDCSELDSSASVAKLIGSPPGYVGYGDGGHLTEAVRRNKNSVVLFDEADKAHPRVFDLLLQMLEEGRLTDAEGRVVDFSATTVILTSNHGAAAAAKTALGFGTAASDRASAEQTVLTAIKSAFRPEFLNRLDKVLVFHSLGREDAETIAALQVAKVAALAAASGLTIKVSPTALSLLAARGFNPVYGARALHRTIQELLTDPLADLILLGRKGTFEVIAVDDQLGFEEAEVLESVPV